MFLRCYVILYILCVTVSSCAMLPGQTSYHDAQEHERVAQGLRSRQMTPIMAYQDGALHAEFLSYLIDKDEDAIFQLICDEMEEVSELTDIMLAKGASSPLSRIIKKGDQHKLRAFLGTRDQSDLQRILLSQLDGSHTPLMLAISALSGTYDTIFIRALCNYALQCGVFSQMCQQRDVKNRTPLLFAVGKGDAQIVSSLCQVAQKHGLLGEVLQQKGCLNKHRVKDLHFNALMVAIVRSAYKNDISLMRVICNYAAQCGVLSHVFHQRDVDNRTPLFCAVNTDNTQIVEFICQVAQEHGLLGEVLQQRGGLNKDGVQDLQWNVLMIAIAQSTCNNDTSLMRVICNYAAQCGVLSHVFHQRDVQNKTPLLYAVGAGNPQIVEFLWQVAQEHGILNEVLQDRAIRDSQHGMTLIDMAISVYNGSLHSSDNGGECYRQKLIRVISILFEKMGQTGILKDKLRISNSSFMSPINPSVGIAIMFQDENLLRAICKSAYNQGILYDVLAFRGTLDGDMMLSWVNRFAPRLLSILLQYAEKREQLLTWCLDELGEKQVWNSLSYIKTYEARQLLYKIIARLPLRYGFLEREDDNADVGGEAYQPSAKRCKTTTSSQKSFSGQMTPCIQQSADTMGTTPLHLYIALYNKQGSIPVEDHAIQKQITHRDHVNDWTPRDLAAALSFQGNGKAIYNKIYDLVDECAICCTPLDRNIQTLDCHHSFHVSCIQQNREYSNTCPYCRQPIS